MEEQNNTILDLIEELNKVVKQYGYRRIKEITITVIDGDYVSYKTCQS